MLRRCGCRLRLLQWWTGRVDGADSSAMDGGASAPLDVGDAEPMEAASTSTDTAGPSSSTEKSATKIRVYWDGRRFLIWDTRHAYELRCAHRIVGSTIGALPTNKRQTCEFGMPICLLFEEALLVCEEGIAEVVDASGLKPAGLDEPPADTPPPVPVGFHAIDSECPAWQESNLRPLDPQQVRLAGDGSRLLHAAIFRALWQRGFYITSGSGFGAEYLAYPGDPLRHHAHLLVHVARPGKPMRQIELSCCARLANTVKKTAVLGEPDASTASSSRRYRRRSSRIHRREPAAGRRTRRRGRRRRRRAGGAGAGEEAALRWWRRSCAAAAGKPTNEEITEVVLMAPLQGHQSVPVKRERQRRPRRRGGEAHGEAVAVRERGERSPSPKWPNFSQNLRVESAET